MTDRQLLETAVGLLRDISAQLTKPRGLLVDCKVCGSCWAGDNDPAEEHDQNRYDVFDKLDGEECALGKARAFLASYDGLATAPREGGLPAKGESIEVFWPGVGWWPALVTSVADASFWAAWARNGQEYSNSFFAAYETSTWRRSGGPR